MLRLLIILILFTILNGCDTYRKVSNQNLYFSYRKEFNTIHPEFNVLNESDSLTRVWYRFSWSEFLFIKGLNDSAFRSSAKLSYRYIRDYESKIVIDSGTVNTGISSSTSVSDMVAQNSFTLNTGIFKNGLIELTLTDLNRNQYVRQFIQVDRSNRSSKQFFLVKKKGEVVMKQILNSQDTLDITHVDPATKQLTVRFYHRNFPLAAPPFSDFVSQPFEYKADSVYILTSGDTGQFRIVLQREGFYHIQSDTATKSGLTLFRFHQDYPMLTSPDELLKPLRYITSKKEYEEMKITANKKAAIDQFWLNNAGSGSRAKELIKTYYNRVQDANQYFGSYLEGWKSDRGLIYMIYGPPTAVYRTNNSESWVYGEENNLRSLQFSFVKVINPFTENDYSLVRNENYKDSWYIAVDTWRQGRVFAD